MQKFKEKLKFQQTGNRLGFFSKILSSNFDMNNKIKNNTLENFIWFCFLKTSYIKRKAGMNDYINA